MRRHRATYEPRGCPLRPARGQQAPPSEPPGFFFFNLIPKLPGTCVMRIERIESAPVNPSHISGDAPLREEEGGGGAGFSS
jgi:hypothetical protein